MTAKAMIIFLREQYTHEANYENYVTNMLWNILGVNAGKGAEMPKRYHEIIQDSQEQVEVKKVTKQSIKDMFLKKQGNVS